MVCQKPQREKKRIKSAQGRGWGQLSPYPPGWKNPLWLPRWTPPSRREGRECWGKGKEWVWSLCLKQSRAKTPIILIFLIPKASVISCEIILYKFFCFQTGGFLEFNFIFSSTLKHCWWNWLLWNHGITQLESLLDGDRTHFVSEI